LSWDLQSVVEISIFSWDKKKWQPWFWGDDEIDKHWYFLDCQVIERVIWWVGGTTLQMSLLSVFLPSDEK
jgi:hypothetical protein